MSVAERRRSPPTTGRPAASITALIAAESPLAAARVEALLRGRPGLEVVVSAPRELARRLDEHPGAIVVLALESAETARALDLIRGVSSVEAVVLLAADPSAAWTAQARRSGVRAVLRADAMADELATAIDAVRAKLVVLHPEALKSSRAARAPQTKGPVALTPREQEILEALAEGLSNRLIAGRLAISSQTVKFHVAAILAKLGAGSRTEAVTFALRQGLIAL
ncbi:MAG TPA: response regulator transcription factor [Methylomirabilota bacterium]|nr:response regulator transcription factor [Methylomirabilota bacterium]